MKAGAQGRRSLGRSEWKKTKLGEAAVKEMGRERGSHAPPALSQVHPRCKSQALLTCTSTWHLTNVCKSRPSLCCSLRPAPGCFIPSYLVPHLLGDVHEVSEERVDGSVGDQDVDAPVKLHGLEGVRSESGLRVSWGCTLTNGDREFLVRNKMMSE